MQPKNGEVMRGKNTIIINGRAYDAATGLPLNEAEAAFAKPKGHAGPVMDIAGPHRAAPINQIQTPKIAPVIPSRTSNSTPNHIKHQPQKSATLHRSALKKPVGTHENNPSHRHTRQSGHVARSTMISKFAPHPQPLAPKPAVQTPVIHPKPVVNKHPVTQPHNKPAPKQHNSAASRALKEQLIVEQLATATPDTKDHAPKKRFFASHPRTSSVIAGCLSLMVLGGYLTYLNMPNLSVRVAAAQSGVNASFPEYRPDGYRFNGPIAYSPGEVTMRFAANGGPHHYEVTQKNSQWDSQAVLDNHVDNVTDSYLTYSEQGMTVYTYENEAAWVNGGILYTIEGDAPLTSEQVLRIAASM